MADTANRVNMHFLKCWPMYYGGLADGTKPFEIRKNDRDYRVGDQLCIQEWEPERERYTGRESRRVITCITGFNQQPGWVVLGLSDKLERI